MAKDITTEGLKKKLDAMDKFYLIDVRDTFRYEHNHLPEAIGLEWGPNFAEELPHVLPDKDSMIVVYGSNEACQMAVDTIEYLEKSGYTNMYLYRDGFAGWMEAGHGLEFGRAS